MATITIKRPPIENGAKAYEIYIDKQKAGTISDGDIMEFNTTNGKHLINLKVGQFSSPEITIETSENKTTSLKIAEFKKMKWVWAIITAIFALHFILKMTIGFRHTTLLIIPVFLFDIYYRKWGWRKHLKLEEEV
ncbi:hypothetical protein [Flavobacterium limnophilum]|uniref:hypothetical protein n=1 Tax=Flavobacterium limnophilum TaxID=3003262 RepID=UPI0022AC285C|nr:hypothetical protein [Flavobacterium limnophilum]